MKTILTTCMLGLALLGCSKEQKASPSPQVTTSNAGVVTVDTKLVNAIHNYGNLELEERFALINKLIEEGASADALNELGEPVLGDAVHFGDGQWDDLRIVRLLVDKGADVNAVGPTKRSPLTKAAENGNLEALRLFLRNRLELNNENGTRALIKAAFHRHKAVVELFLAHGFQPEGKYEEATRGLKSDETRATAALFGAYVDIVKQELLPLLRAHAAPERQDLLRTQLTRIEQSCAVLTKAHTYTYNMGDFFHRAEECTEMGRLGALANMHCFGLRNGHSANLQGLVRHVDQASASARAPIDRLEGMSFEAIANTAELLSYDHDVRIAMALYQDMLLPTMARMGTRMGHHAHRNRELRDQADHCRNPRIQQGAAEIRSALAAVQASLDRQAQSFRKELALMNTLRAKIAYQVPALRVTEKLRAAEEEERKKKE